MTQPTDRDLSVQQQQAGRSKLADTRRRSRRQALALGLAGLALPLLAACGRRGDPVRPDSSDPAYPRRYPDPETVLPNTEGRRLEPMDQPSGSVRRGPQGPDAGLDQDPWMNDRGMDDDGSGEWNGWRNDAPE